jgi:hypothetical protein
MGNAQVTVCNDLDSSIEVMSYNDADHVYFIPKEKKDIQPGFENTLSSAGKRIVKLKAIYQSYEYGPYTASDGGSYLASNIFGIRRGNQENPVIIAEVIQRGNPFVTMGAHDQGQSKLCWAYTAATLVRAAQARSGKRKLTPHCNIVKYLSDKHGNEGNHTNAILPEVMEKHDFYSTVRPVDLGEAVMIGQNTERPRPLLLHISWTARQRETFGAFSIEIARLVETSSLPLT